MIETLDHLNIRTGQLDKMIAWYCDILRLENGPRPPFPFPGAWLYAHNRAIVHLVDADPAPADQGSDLKLEHGAFRASGYEAFLARLEAAGERFEVSKVPDMPIVQVNIWDPDGNHLHVDFDASEVPKA